MMGWHHADGSTFSVHIKTVGITGEEWISAFYLSFIEINGFIFPASLFNLFLPNRHFVFEVGREEGECTLLIVLSSGQPQFFSSDTPVRVVEGSVWEEDMYWDFPFAKWQRTFCLTMGWQTRSEVTLFIIYAGDHRTLPFPKYNSVSESGKSKQRSGNIYVFPELTISLAGKEKGKENLNLNVPPSTHTDTHTHTPAKRCIWIYKNPSSSCVNAI